MRATAMTNETLSPAIFPTLQAAAKPPEARGLERDGIRMLVTGSNGRVAHRHFRDLVDELGPGDLVVVNVSATRPAALRIEPDRALHVSSSLPGGRDRWLVELRRRDGAGTRHDFTGRPGQVLSLPAGRRATLLAHRPTAENGPRRLWVARIEPSIDDAYFLRHGEPIRYAYTGDTWPIASYQNVYATEPGSAEMPSAGRGFTSRLLNALEQRDVELAPVVLHTGVSSLEGDERPHEEYYRVPPETIAACRSARRVVAVGTSVVRALESWRRTGRLDGWTDLILGAEDAIVGIDGLISGFHPPEASHLDMLTAFVGEQHLRHAYDEAAREGYLSHEFGDAHLMWR